MAEAALPLIQYEHGSVRLYYYFSEHTVRVRVLFSIEMP